MTIQLSDKFTYGKLIKFTVPSIIMMIITSVYGVVDGLFVSNFVGKNAFTSLNLIMPFVMIFSAFSFMFGTGGGALVAKYLGEQNKNKANGIFSMIISTLIIVAILCATLGIVFIERISLLLGATPELLADCVNYGTIVLAALPFFMLQTAFQTFVVVANKPNMGLHLSIASGLTNIVLDYLFIVLFHWGIAGAALATAAGQILGGVIPFIYFLSPKSNSMLHLVKFKWDFKALFDSCINGSSEMMTSISMSLINILYNLQLMKFFEADGVSAYGIIMYVSFIFTGVFIGYTIGVSPIVSYNYGSQNHAELKSLFKKNLILMSSTALVLTVIAEIFSPQLVNIFVGYDERLLKISITALRLYSLSYLVSHINIFGSAFFTALNNGKISALISFLRTLVFQAVMIMVLPYILGKEGIWLAVLFAEISCVIVTMVMFKKNNKYYGYY